MSTLRAACTILLFCFSCFGFYADAQESIEVSPANSVDALVREELIKDSECIDIFNVELIGSLGHVGSFSNGATSINLEEGIFFTTGALEDALGPNFAPNTSGGFFNLVPDEDLRRLSNNIVFDAVGIEFDFVPTGSVVAFNYVFASEEYCEFVDTEFNDAFGFFVSGPGLAGPFVDGGINVAIIPNSADFVTINNVNHLTNSNFFVNNVLDLDAVQCGIPFDPRAPNGIEFDGYTRPLTASFEVMPCDTYHIRLVVGDIGDANWDSAVFLEGQSFDLGGEVEVGAEVVETEEAIIYEDCLSGQFTFGRKPTVPRDREITITFRIEGTAEEGVDYEPLNTTVVIPPFGPRVTVPIIPIPDNLEEGLESILLIYESDNCGCIIADTATLFLLDPDISVQTSFEELEACAGQDFTFEPVIDFGREPFSFLWSDGSTEETLTVNIDEPSTFAVTVMDACGNSAIATTTVGIKEPPSLTIEGTYTWCEGRAPELAPILLQGQAPWNIIYSVNDSLQPEITGITESPYLLPLDQAGTYEITSFSDAACEGTIMGVIEVLPIPLALDFEATLPSCPNAPDGSIRLFPEGGVKPYAFEWDTLGITSEELLNLQPGSYAVTVTDAEGCIVMESITLPSPANAVCDLDLDANLFVPNAFSPNNDGFNDEFTIYPNPQSIIQELSYQIYDRWGGLRFETPTFPLGNTVLWRPDTNVPIGVYVCIVKITLVDGTSQLLGQDVLLIR